jgi:hypothetical protein
VFELVAIVGVGGGSGEGIVADGHTGRGGGMPCWREGRT